MLSNEQYKKIRKRRLNNFLLFYTFIILFVCFNMTLSKYGAMGTSTSTTSVAAWRIKVNEENIDTSKTFQLTNNQETTNTKTANRKIAPDSSGYFEVILDLTDTEVSIDYKLEIDTSILEKNNINVELTGYTINDGEQKPIENNTITGEKLLNEISNERHKFTRK